MARISTTMAVIGIDHRHGTLRWRASSEPQAQGARPRRAADAGQVRAAPIRRAEE